MDDYRLIYRRSDCYLDICFQYNFVMIAGQVPYQIGFKNIVSMFFDGPKIMDMWFN